MPYGVIQPLCVDDDLCPCRQRNARLGGRIVLVLAKDHQRVGVVGEIEEGTHNPPRALGIETIVVITVQVVERVRIRIWLQLDDAAATDVRAGLERTLDKSRCGGNVGGNPDPVLIGLGRRVVPESVALHVAVGTGQRGKARITGGLPIDVLDIEPLMRVSGLVIGVQNYVASLGEHRQRDVVVNVHKTLLGTRSVCHFECGDVRSPCRVTYSTMAAATAAFKDSAAPAMGIVTVRSAHVRARTLTP